MYEDWIIHAGSEKGEALCGKPLKDFAKDEVLQSPHWDGVTCSVCDQRRVSIKRPEDRRQS